MRLRTALPVALTALLLAGFSVTACSSDSGSEGAAKDGTTTTAVTSAVPEAIVFNGQGNNLDAYEATPGTDGKYATQRVWTTVATDPVHGRDLNAQICFLPKTEDGEQWFIGGEDTHQDDPTYPPGWGIFRLEGDEVGKLKATEIGKLVPTFQPTARDGAENYGCGRLSDGRVLTTDIGNQASGDGDGQLIVWFPPLTGGEFVEPDEGATEPGHPDFDEVAYCKLDVELATAQSILVRDDVIYVASARGSVFKYEGPFPTAADAKGGCGKKDATGAPMADTVKKSVFIKAGEHGLATPAGLADAPDDGFYVSSVFTGVINEYDPDGTFRRTILEPPKGESVGKDPYSTGTPLGIGVGPDGTLYYADIGVVVDGSNVGPGDHTGTLRRIRFVDGKPQAPEIIADDLEYPDGIGVLIPD